MNQLPPIPADRNPAAPPAEDIPALPSRPLTAREKYYYEQSYQELVAGAAATTSGLYVAKAKLALGAEKGAGLLWLAPFACWGASLICLILVLLPQEYLTTQNTPAAWEQAFRQARKTKYRWLLTGAVLFIAGILAAVLPLAFSLPVP